MGDPNKPTLVARLSKDGKRVLCGHSNCGQTLADAVVIAGMGRVMGFGASGRPWQGFDRNHEGQTREVGLLTVFYRSETPDTPTPCADRCTIVFGAGWFPDTDGVWTQTKSAQKRYDAERKIALGGLGVSARERERARQRLASGRTARFAHPAADRHSGVTRPHHPEHRADLPSEARCPDCRRVSVRA